jgi:hypothetical protein
MNLGDTTFAIPAPAQFVDQVVATVPGIDGRSHDRP